MFSALARIPGLGELPSHEGALAHKWQKRLRWLVPVALLLTIPAFYLELTGAQLSPVRTGWTLYLIATLALALYLGLMLRACRQRREFLQRNWLDAALTVGVAASLAGSFGDWSSLEWSLRLLLVVLTVVRILFLLKRWFSPSGTLYLLGLSMITLALAGAGFYWLEPTVTSYADGLWLAFESGATVGYGDIVPTAPAARVFAVFMVLLGYALLSLVTASIAAFFIGEDEKQLRREFHHDIRQLREEVKALRAELQRHYLVKKIHTG